MEPYEWNEGNSRVTRNAVYELTQFVWREAARLDPPSGWSGSLAQAWLAHTTKTTQAALLLYERGYTFEAAPLRRSVFEHGMWMLWLVDHRDDAKGVLDSKFRLSVQRNEAPLREWASWAPEEVDRILARPSQHVPSLKEIIAALVEIEPTSTMFYGIYWSDSNLSHPGTETAADHRNVEHDFDANLGSALLFSVIAFSLMLPGYPWSAKILDYAARFKP